MVNPYIVRTVHDSLNDAAKSAAIVGAAGVVNTLIGGLWGTLFSNFSNDREMLNILGEIGGRSLNPTAQKVASKTYLHTLPASKSNNGRIQYYIPNRFDDELGSYTDLKGNPSRFPTKPVDSKSNLFNSELKYNSDFLKGTKQDNNNNNNNKNKNNQNNNNKNGGQNK